jgi:hypothetical protein
MATQNGKLAALRKREAENQSTQLQFPYSTKVMVFTFGRFSERGNRLVSQVGKSVGTLVQECAHTERKSTSVRRS